MLVNKLPALYVICHYFSGVIKYLACLYGSLNFLSILFFPIAALLHQNQKISGWTNGFVLWWMAASENCLNVTTSHFRSWKDGFEPPSVWAPKFLKQFWIKIWSQLSITTIRILSRQVHSKLGCFYVCKSPKRRNTPSFLDAKKLF